MTFLILNTRYWVRHEAVSVFPTIAGRGLLNGVRHTFHLNAELMTGKSLLSL